MDLEFLPRLSFCGHTLNVEERAGLQVAMAKRAAAEGLPAIDFWGKIIGAEGAYLVCVALLPSETGLPNKRFYYCTLANLELQELPEPSDREREAARRRNDKFKGDPTHVVEEFEAKDGEEDGAGTFTEAKRLACTVRAIDSATSVVPRESYAVAPTGSVHRNRAFDGVSHAQAEDLSRYVHLRTSANPKRRAAAEAVGEGSTDFLDPISEDLPHGCWSVQLNSARTQVSLRSLHWPGYFFYHRVSTPDFGGAYFGDGRENVDLVFML